jgi:Ca2+-binding EF-hand superfamily protein
LHRVDQRGIKGEVTVLFSDRKQQAQRLLSVNNIIQLEQSSITIESLFREYKAIERNLDGLLELEELQELIRRAGGSSSDANAFSMQFFTIADPNEDGLASFSEFISEFQRMQIFRVVAAFQQQHEVDADTDGLVNKGELLQALSSQLGSWTAVELVERLFQQPEVAHAGAISVSALNDWYFTQEAATQRRRQRGLARRNAMQRCGQCRLLSIAKAEYCSRCGAAFSSVLVAVQGTGRILLSFRHKH